MNDAETVSTLTRRLAAAETALRDKAKLETELRKAQERQAVLLAELQHRVRNILAQIRSIASRTGTPESSIEEFRAHFDGRISALARTQSVLTRSPGEGVDLELLLRDELLAQAAKESRFRISGPRVRLSPRAAEVMALAFHELATNATKYGALFQKGRIDITWQTEQREGTPWLVLQWIESGSSNTPPVLHRSGFGTDLIKRRIPYELRGEGMLDLLPAGMHAKIAFPLSSRQSVLETESMVAANGKP